MYLNNYISFSYEPLIYINPIGFTSDSFLHSWDKSLFGFNIVLMQHWILYLETGFMFISKIGI